MKGSKLKKVEIKISIDNIKVEDIKTKVLFLTFTCLFIVLITTIDVKFASSFACFTAVSGQKGMFSSADILQIADVMHRIVFWLAVLALFLGSSPANNFFFVKREMFRHFHLAPGSSSFCHVVKEFWLSQLI